MRREYCTVVGTFSVQSVRQAPCPARVDIVKSGLNKLAPSRGLSVAWIEG